MSYSFCNYANSITVMLHLQEIIHFLFTAQGINRIQFRCPAGWHIAEYKTDSHRHAEGNQNGSWCRRCIHSHGTADYRGGKGANHNSDQAA